jgi:arginine-tRNA-protein transferase
MSDAPRTKSKLGFYLTPEHECPYLEDRTARTAFADPTALPDLRAQTQLAEAGFRRSGGILYRPRCPSCQACVPLRLAVDAFAPNRTQRRIAARNEDLVGSRVALSPTPEQLALFDRYQQARHPEGAMFADDAEHYLAFFASGFSSTAAYELRLGDRLVAVMVVDHLLDALSAVYTYFDPELGSRSLGTYAVLWQIAAARRERLRWLYLGYLIEETRKMAYKAAFRPQQRLIAGEWREA